MHRLVWIAVVAACRGNAPSSPPPAPAPAAKPTEPTAASPLPKDHTISVRREYACALTHDRHVACWGAVGTAHQKLLRPTALAGLDNAVGIAANDADVCAWRTDGHAICSRLSGGPPELIANLDHVDELAADDQVVCARHTGRVTCWARDRGTDALGPLTEAAGITDAVQIAVSYYTACARRATGDVVCWAEKPTNIGGKPAFSETPQPIPGVKGARALVGSNRRYAAILADGTGYGWDVFNQRSTLPAGQLNVLAFGDMTVCAQAAGAVRCTAPQSKPTDLPELAGAVELSTADFVGCARMPGGQVRCWGSIDGLGIGEPMEQPRPVEVAGIDDAIALAGNDSETTCAIRKTGRVACWGAKLLGVFNAKDPGYDLQPIDLGLDQVSSVDLGMYNGCARTTDHKLWCWGFRNANASKHWDKPTAATKYWATVPHGPTTRWHDGEPALGWSCVRRRSGVSCIESMQEHRDASETHDKDYDSLTDIASLVLPANQDDTAFVLHTTGVVEMLVDGDWKHAMDGVAEIVHVAPDDNNKPIECARKRTGSVVCWQGADIAAAKDLGITDAVALVGSHSAVTGRGCVLRKTGHVVCWGTRELLGNGGSSTRGPTDVPGASL